MTESGPLPFDACCGNAICGQAICGVRGRWVADYFQMVDEAMTAYRLFLADDYFDLEDDYLNFRRQKRAAKSYIHRLYACDNFGTRPLSTSHNYWSSLTGEDTWYTGLGQLRQSDMTQKHVIVSADAYANVGVRVAMRTLGTQSNNEWYAARVLFNVVDANNYFSAVIGIAGYVAIVKCVNGVETAISTTPAQDVRYSEWCTVDIKVKGTSVVVSFNDNVTLNLTDALLASGGKVGLMSDHANTRFSLFRAYRHAVLGTDCLQCLTTEAEIGIGECTRAGAGGEFEATFRAMADTVAPSVVQEFCKSVQRRGDGILIITPFYEVAGLGEMSVPTTPKRQDKSSYSEIKVKITECDIQR